MNDDRATTRGQKLLAALPFTLIVLFTLVLFVWSVVVLMLPRIVPVEVAPDAAPTVTISPEATGEPVEGVYVNPEGGAYCFQGEELLGAVPSPDNCEQVLSVKTAWDTKTSIGVWHYNLPAVYWNTEDEAWDCYYQGEYSSTASTADCLEDATAVAFANYQEKPLFVVELPTLFAVEGDGYPCAVGNKVVGYAQNPRGCDAVYLDSLTAVPYRV